MDDSRRRPNAIARARAIFAKHGGLLRMSAALRDGIHRGTLAAMVRRGEVHRVSRGLSQLADAPLPPHPDLVAVIAKAPKGVICLISALAFHELTTQIPHEVHFAIGRNMQPPRLDYPPVHTYRFSGRAFREGVEWHAMGSFQAPVYSREKTLADCFKYRNKIGLDTCLEALRIYRRQPGYDVDELLRCAAVCRVTKVMRPYLETVQ